VGDFFSHFSLFRGRRDVVSLSTTLCVKFRDINIFIFSDVYVSLKYKEYGLWLYIYGSATKLLCLWQNYQIKENFPSFNLRQSVKLGWSQENISFIDTKVRIRTMTTFHSTIFLPLANIKVLNRNSQLSTMFSYLWPLPSDFPLQYDKPGPCPFLKVIFYL